MKVLVVMVMVVMTVVQASITLSPFPDETNATASLETETECTCTGHSLLSGLLQAAGCADTCMASAVEFCSSAHEEGNFKSLVKKARRIVKEAGEVIKQLQSRPRHCKDLLDSGDSGTGLRQVFPYGDRPHHRVTVYCDHVTNGGGWTLFQRRSNDAVRQDFYRSWLEYELGFGDLEGEFWAGLRLLNEMTSDTLQELLVDLHDYEGGHKQARYEIFHVAGPETNYTLTAGRYSGDAGDSMAVHSGKQFTTHDADHDTHAFSNCAQEGHGAWWYKHCGYSNLNGYQHVGDSVSDQGEGIVWYHWHGPYYSLKKTAMMIRPAF